MEQNQNVKESPEQKQAQTIPSSEPTIDIEKIRQEAANEAKEQIGGILTNKLKKLVGTYFDVDSDAIKDEVDFEKIIRSVSPKKDQLNTEMFDKLREKELEVEQVKNTYEQQIAQLKKEADNKYTEFEMNSLVEGSVNKLPLTQHAKENYSKVKSLVMTDIKNSYSFKKNDQGMFVAFKGDQPVYKEGTKVQATLNELVEDTYKSLGFVASASNNVNPLARKGAEGSGKKILFDLRAK